MTLIGKLLRDPSTLKLMRDPVSKKLMRANPYGVDCENCDAGTTPKRITLTFSGVIQCTNCYPYAGNYTKWVHNFDINQSFILEQSANSCIWIYTEPNGVTCEFYSDDACQNLVSSNNKDVLFVAYMTDASHRVSLTVYELTYSSEYFKLILANRDSNCVNLADAANEKTECLGNLGYGGMVTFADGA